MIITKEILNSVNIGSMKMIHMESDVNWSEFCSEPGTEHYKFLAYLTTLFKGRDIFDIGTHRGASALALSYNSENTVYSFDISQKYRLPTLQNVNYVIEDLWNSECRSRWEERLLGSAFIFLDIDPHEGTREFEFYQWLKAKNYRGFLVLDDILHFQAMRDNLWLKIPGGEKIDATYMGHWSGTGIVEVSSCPNLSLTLR
jgi:predicted O-methyltransferase YrrM